MTATRILLPLLALVALSAAPAQSQTITILVNVPVHETGFFLDIDPSDTISELMDTVSQRLSLGSAKQFWFFQGQLLQNNQTIAFHNVTDGDQVDVGLCSGTQCSTEQMLRIPRPCKENDAQVCSATAFCEDFGNGGICLCPEGLVGDGYDRRHGGSECNREAWSVRVTLDLGAPATTREGQRLRDWEVLRSGLGSLFFQLNSSKPSWFDKAMHHTVVERRYVTINALFMTEQAAQEGLSAFRSSVDQSQPAQVFGIDLVPAALTTEPRVYIWVSKTSDAELRVLPTGMDVRGVYFSHDCMTSGCWVVDLIYTTGEDNFNVFYIPRAIGNDDLSYDFDYSATPDYALPYGKSPADTFLPLNFPCGSDGYQYHPSADADIPDRVSACCIEEFAVMYRPIEAFLTDEQVVDVLGDSRDTYCSPNATRKIWNSTHLPDSALFGNFSGMDGLARVDFKSVEDPFIRQFTATVYLDEVALRRQAGILTGAVGVAHAIDTFIGFANFKPTGLEFLDAFAAQTNIHLEKTNFFTVSAYGENQITFLEYVNLRLVTVIDTIPEPFGNPDEYYLTAPLKPYPEYAGRGNVSLHYSSQILITEDADGGLSVHYYLTHAYDGWPNPLPWWSADTHGEIHVHEGTSCDSHEEVGGHLYSTPTDPWTSARWSKEAGSLWKWSRDSPISVPPTGYSLQAQAGRVVVVHDQRGARIACGVLQPSAPGHESRANTADYLQVTFTLGEQYQPIETGIVPIDSVLVSKGDFISSSETLDTRFHACSEWLDGSFEQIDVFRERFPEPTGHPFNYGFTKCAPNVTFCHSPRRIPDQFVSFNIPLGIDWLPQASNNLDSNVFVDLVVSVIDTHQIKLPGGVPNNGDPAEQMKTTLQASIPVVEGGVYIFCDSVERTEDLLSVANADLVLGSAGFDHEFERLRVIRDLGSAPSFFESVHTTRIDSDSIEAGLMTLVLKGNSSYFDLVADYSLEVEDLITVHVLEPESGPTYARVLELLRTPGIEALSQDEGFPLNGAFRFRLDPAGLHATLDPTSALEELCPFRPQRPDPADLFPASCVARRDIRARAFPAVVGKNATAIELPAAHVALDDAARDGVAEFMQLVLNPSLYSAQLGRNFSHIVAQRYQLNGRYNRAFWINPGYEWTPQQTGGQDRFTLSQKLVMFALINMVEGGASSTRRRMLLQSSSTPTQDSGAGVSAQEIVFNTSPQSMMASLYDIPEDLIATFSVQMQLSHLQACMSTADLRRSLRSSLDAFVLATSSQYETVQITSMALQQADVQCTGRRLLARQPLSFSPASASLEMMVVFSPSRAAAIDLRSFANMEGVIAISPLAVSNSIQTTAPPDQYLPTNPDDTTLNTPHAPSDDDHAAPQDVDPNAPNLEATGGKDMSLVIWVAAGCAALLAVGGAYVAYRRRAQPREVSVLASIDINEHLKAELALPPVERGRFEEV